MAEFKNYFNSKTLVEDVDVNDWESVVDALENRFVVWWFEPFSQYPKTGHEAFPVLLSMCAVIGGFSSLTGMDVPSFLRVFDSQFNTKFDFSEMDAADVFYVHVFCNMLEDCGIENPAGMSGTGKIVVSVDGTVIFDPWVLRDTLLTWFADYCKELKQDSQSENSIALRVYLNNLGLDVKCVEVV